MPADEAAAATRRTLGNVSLAREDARAVWIWSWLESTRQDVQYAVRNLRRQPGFALLAIATLGSAIGINTSLFTAFNALFLRPWPAADVSNVYEVKVTYGGNVHSGNEEFSVREYRHLREHTRSLSGLVASTCIDDREPQCRVKLDREPVGTLFVSRNYFSVLGIPLERGPGLDGAEERPDAVAVISYGLWQRRFGGDFSIIGKPIQINDAPFTVVGVTARDFTGTSFGRKDLWIPLAAKALVHPEESGEISVRLAGRLTDGVPRTQAVTELDVLRRQFRSELARPADPSLQGRITLDRTSFNPNPGKSRSAFQVFGVLALGTFLVLILACANVGNLLLARGASRGRELAVRLSLGAGRRRLLRQLLTESLVLAGLAACVGVGIAYVVPPLFVDWIYAQFRAFGTRPFSVSPDTAVLAWTAGSRRRDLYRVRAGSGAADAARNDRCDVETQRPCRRIASAPSQYSPWRSGRRQRRAPDGRRAARSQRATCSHARPRIRGGSCCGSVVRSSAVVSGGRQGCLRASADGRAAGSG